MPFSIDEFKATVNKRRGFARASNFRMLVTGGILTHSSARALGFLLNSAQIPGRQLQTIDVVTHGVVRKQPYGMNAYDDLTVNVYCTNKNLFPRDLFQEWQDLIVNSNNFNAYYFDQYVSSIEIESYDDRGEVQMTCKFEEAYPLFVGPLQVDWSAGSSILNLQVSFAYKKWRFLPAGGLPFGGNLEINSLYPAFDLGGFIDNNSVAIVDRTSGQIMDRVRTAGRFLSNI
jgi:hypothetical protein